MKGDIILGKVLFEIYSKEIKLKSRWITNHIAYSAVNVLVTKEAILDSVSMRNGCTNCAKCQHQSNKGEPMLVDLLNIKQILFSLKMVNIRDDNKQRWWWRHNWLGNCDAHTWKIICNLLDLDFIHGDIHGRSCKKHIHACVYADYYCGRTF